MTVMVTATEGQVTEISFHDDIIMVSFAVQKGNEIVVFQEQYPVRTNVQPYGQFLDLCRIVFNDVYVLLTKGDWSYATA